MYDSQHLAELMRRMATELESLQLHQPVVVGIHTGGVWVAQHLLPLLPAITAPLCTLDISFYRDDFSRVGLNPEVRASTLPLELDGLDIVLVDDVLHTGRTVRAALNEIFSYGRPERVVLAVLIDRAGRELPICADVVGATLALQGTQQVKLSQTKRALTLNIVDPQS